MGLYRHSGKLKRKWKLLYSISRTVKGFGLAKGSLCAGGGGEEAGRFGLQ